MGNTATLDPATQRGAGEDGLGNEDEQQGPDELAARREAEGEGEGGGGEPPQPPAALPEDPKGDDRGEQPTDQLELLGDRPLKLNVGGRKPDAAVLKVKGGKIEMGKSQFERGDRFLGVFTLQVTGNNDQDTIDRLGGEVKSTSRTQNATVCGTARLEEFLADKIESRDLLVEVLEALGLEPLETPAAA